MPVAEGVGHLGDDRDERAGRVMAEPEADRVEDMAQNTRLRQQLEPAVRPNLVTLQHLAHPGGAASLPGGPP